MLPQSKQQLAKYIDHTLLSATAIKVDIEKLCHEAIDYGFCSVCINPRWVPLAAKLLHLTKVKVCSVVGFPLGADPGRVKAMEAKDVIMAGADEVDMVADLASVIQIDEEYLLNDIAQVSKVCRSMRPVVTLKVIIESAALTDEQIAFACQVCQRAGANFVKTSTGLNPAGGAKARHVSLMAESAPACKIKAAGGIRTSAQALEMIAAGASRLGTSASAEIIDTFSSESP